MGAPQQDDDRQPPRLCVFAPSPRCSVTIEVGAAREPQIHVHPAGQGAWVGRMARVLGAEVVLCGAFGGEVGSVLVHLLEQERVVVRRVPCDGSNGGYVHDRSSGERRTVAEAPGPSLTRHQLDDLYGITLAEGLDTGLVVLTGTEPPSLVPVDVYARLARDLQANGATVVADLGGEPLAALAGGVEWLKVSVDDFGDRRISEAGEPELVPILCDLQRRGSRNVVLSRGAQPALVLVGERRLRVHAPRLEAREPRGAGDSMTAALAVSLQRGLPPEEGLRLAAAAGALNVTRHGMGSGVRESIEVLARQVQVEQLAAD